MTKAVAVLPSASKALAALDRLVDEIELAPSLDVADAIANAAAGYQRQFKPVREVADRAGEVWVIAEAKIGIELAKMPKAKGGAPYQKRSTGSNMAPVDATLKEIGVDKKRATRAQKLASMPTTERTAHIEQLKAAGKGVTPNAVLAAARKEKKSEKREAALKAIFSETGPFDVVVIDPPWPMMKIDRDERPNQAEFDYPTMTVDELASFWPQTIAVHVKDDCHLFCWTTQKYLPAALALVEKWGFRYVLTMVWHKPGGFQPHDLPQYNSEFIIYARKGTPIFTDTTDFRVCSSWPRREHSRKPEEFYDLIRRVTGGSRIDIFSRERHRGFAQYGNEITKFSEAVDAVL
jgi:N6-adenosine-specific RNA methylase IME4